MVSFQQLMAWSTLQQSRVVFELRILVPMIEMQVR